MARTILDTQMHEIRTRIIRLGTLVEIALEYAIQSVQNGDQALCGLVIAADGTIDSDSLVRVDGTTAEASI